MRGRRGPFLWLPRSAAAALALLAVAGLGQALAAGPPFPDPEAGKSVYDTANVLPRAAEDAAGDLVREIARKHAVRVVVYTQRKPDADTAVAKVDAAALLEQWQVGGSAGNGMVLMFDLGPAGREGVAAIAAGPGFHERFLDERALEALAGSLVEPGAEAGDIPGAITETLSALSALRATATTGPSGSVVPSGASPRPSGSGSPLPGATPSAVPAASGPAGPPYPAPVENVVVYDFANIFEPVTESTLTATIATIEQRTGAEIVVYSQVKPESDTSEEAERDAAALIDQWGIGRKGFDDGLAILFDMDQPSGTHGQVQLFGAPGYRATYLSDRERQEIFEKEMLPLLGTGDMDGAVLAAMRRIDSATTPEHAASLNQARQLDGAMGLLVAPGLLMLLVGWAGWHWLRYGRDPEYLDDPSILMPAPPRDLTAATGALIMEGRATRLALTTAMLDLASRGELAFIDESGKLSKKVSLQLLEPRTNDPQLARARRRPLSEAEEYALGQLHGMPHHADGVISQEDLLGFGASVGDFDRKLERHAVAKGWLRDEPGKVTNRWAGWAFIEVIAGVVVLAVALALGSQGFLLTALGLIAAGIATFIIARQMPARTMAGAMIRAMLQAYQRTLRKTMELARSMQQVVESRAAPWLETPDQALVWSVALGLREDVQRVLARSVEDAQAGNTASSQAWLPAWYGGSALTGTGTGGGSLDSTTGLFSSSVIPNVDSMFAAVGTIGDSPSSSGSSGGFSGGSSGGGGGGGGGAGGGF
ncbi:MAG: TPM domain-containing protein [Chloroflexi bacterium]|nr:TPM domain-containing protein [Chloroflexota bacterium]